MSKVGPVAWIAIFAAIGLEPPLEALPARDISAEVERMTKRHGLTKDQAKIVNAILDEQARKADELAKDTSLSLEEKVHRMLAIKDEETTRVSDALPPEQRKKYLADLCPARCGSALDTDSGRYQRSHRKYWGCRSNSIFQSL